MLDRTLHAALKPLLARVAGGLVRLGLSANALSFIGFGLGLAAATAVALGRPLTGLALLLLVSGQGHRSEHAHQGQADQQFGQRPAWAACVQRWVGAPSWHGHALSP